MRLKVLIVAIVASILLSTVLSSEQVTASDNLKSPPYYDAAENQAAGGIVPTRLFLMKGGKLAPVVPYGASAGATQCPNGYKQTGLFGFGILPFGTVEWKDVGTWKTDAIQKGISMSGSAAYQVCLNNTGTKNITGAALEFTLKDSSTVIAGPVVVDNINVPSGQTIATTPVSAKINVTSLSEGKILSVFIRAKYSSGKNGGDTLQLVYGAPQYLSHASIPTDAVKMGDGMPVVSKNQIKLVYTDAFNIDWTMYGENILLINNERNNNSANRPTIVKTDGSSCEYMCSWPVNLKGGTKYNITVALDYSGPPAWSKSVSVDIPAEKAGFLPGFETMTAVAGIAIMAVAFRKILQKS